MSEKHEEIVNGVKFKLKQAEQIIDLVLFDGDDYCEIISDLRPVDGGNYFVTHNKETGAKYRVTITSEEI